FHHACESRQRIEAEASIHLFLRFLVPSEVRQEVSVAQMRERIVRVDLHSLPELLFGTLPIPVEVEFDPTKSGMGFGQPSVDLQCLERRVSRLWKSLARRDVAPDRH